ncbi:magnesium transporter CorA family protein [Naumannella sp. ID2617S]|nr:magnesium transporter CorA family protein [Naumannella sp. ID2617S]
MKLRQTGRVNRGVRVLQWRDGRRTPAAQELTTVEELIVDPDSLVWVDLVDPDASELALLAREVGLDPHAVEDAVAPAERPKAMRHASHTFLAVYAAWLGQDAGEELHDSRLVTSRINCFVLPFGFITVRADDRFDMDQVVERWETEAALMRLGVGALAHGLLDVIVDGHFDTIQQLDDAAEATEDELFEHRISRTVIQQQVYRLRKELVGLRRVVLPMREVVNTLIHYRSDLQVADHGLDGYYQDLYDHVMRAAEWTESLRDVVGSIFETNLSLQDAQLNQVMKKLAGWAAVIAVPTAITGWFGQNVPFWGNGEPLGLILSVALILLITATVFLLLRRRDWI